MVREKSRTDFQIIAEMLPLLKAGSVIVAVNDFPLLKADAESKSLDIEIRSAKKTGLDVQTFLKAGSRRRGVLEILKSSEPMAKALHQSGWKVSVYDSGSTLVTMGRGVSALTGYIRANPLKLMRVLSSL